MGYDAIKNTSTFGIQNVFLVPWNFYGKTIHLCISTVSQVPY